MTDFLAKARVEVVANIGQVDQKAIRSLEKAAKAGEIAKWRGKWFPVAGAPFGIGPDKTCYGPIGSHERWAGFTTV